MYFDGRTANYDKEPYLEITQKDAQAFQGFEEITDCLKMRIKQLQKERSWCQTKRNRETD